MLIKEIMRKAITVDKDQRLSSVIKYFDRYGISRQPVTENKGLVGIITERDVMEKIGSPSGGLKASGYHVSSCMTHNPVCILADQDVYEAIEVFNKRGFSGMPVMGEATNIVTKIDIIANLEIEGAVEDAMNGRFATLKRGDRVVHARKIFLKEDPPLIPIVDEDIVGIITKRDVLFGLYKFREMVDKHQDSIIRNYTVEKIMSRTPVTTTSRAPLSDIKKIIVEKDFNALPVVDQEGGILGIIGKDEMMQKVRIS